MHLFVDSQPVSRSLGLAAWSASEDELPELDESIQIASSDGYVKDHREYRKLERRCRIVEGDEEGGLRRFLDTYLVPRGKAARLGRDCCIPPSSTMCALFSSSKKKETSTTNVVDVYIQEVKVASLRLVGGNFPELKVKKLVLSEYGRFGRKFVESLDRAQVALSETVAIDSSEHFPRLVKSLRDSDKVARCEGIWLIANGDQLDFYFDRDLLVWKDDAIAADFYNSLERNKESQGDTRIYHLRRFNNFIKSELISDALGNRDHLRVLDLACGKGGDLNKIGGGNNNSVSEYVGVDIAKTSLQDLAERLLGRVPRGFKSCAVTLLVASLGSTPLSPNQSFETYATNDASIRGEWSTGDLTNTPKFDVATMQFALHYMFESETRATTFFADLASRLKVGASFVATTVDAVALARLILTRARPATRNGRDDWWRVDISDESTESAKGLGPVRNDHKVERLVLTVWMENEIRRRLLNGSSTTEDLYGLRYWFQLYDSDDAAAVDSPEWLAPRPLLAKLAADHGFILEDYSNFADYLETRRHKPGFVDSINRLRVPDRHGSISPAEWDVATLYAALKFKKMPSEAQMALSFPKVIKAYGAETWKAFDEQTRLRLVTACAEGRDRDWMPPAS